MLLGRGPQTTPAGRVDPRYRGRAAASIPRAVGVESELALTLGPDPPRTGKVTVTQLAEYYRDRAAEYDVIYAKPERQADLASLHNLLPPLVAGSSVLEIAAGTGYWTRTLSTSAEAVTATDLSTETLDVARTRKYGPASVAFQVADAYALDQVPGQFDVAFIGFFWSHILRGDLPRFLTGLHARLGPGARVIVLDNLYVHGSSTPVSRTTGDGDTFQQRTLTDGRSYEILKNFPAREEFATDVVAWAPDAKWTELQYFWLATLTLAPNGAGGQQPWR
jgi:ubiquinone/menaquinone biosynthesis C-methylase UbiE